MATAAIPVIVLTAYSTKENILKTIDAGAADILTSESYIRIQII
jgi:CheY-like chemotaxis protein